ncbi:MAG: DNA repair protein RecO [candidate division Zixibacteria bacterium]|nr:DNA repair protein RecO [candidate division Zixibacteria bacterium]MDH3939106.1 DNA repair protein RecO [candidate division Zixibacteria bacterium]MDH4033001.1 DNA repair protein RecO [candidate division Zixibacteria bacterium]
MALEKTDAVVLRTFNWSESSRTVVFFTRNFGKIALVDKGGRSIKSKRGRIVSFAHMELTFYASEKESNGYIRDVDPMQAFSFEKDGAVGRLAYGSAACELLNLLLPDEEPQETLFDYFVGFLSAVEVADKRSLPGLFLAFFLRLLSHLGYHPSLTHCPSCGQQAVSLVATRPTEYIQFYPERGGVLCSSCQTAADHYIRLSTAGFEQLVALQTASLTEAAALPIAYADTELLLEALTKFMSFQTGLSAKIKSLEFLKKLKDTKLT